MQPLRRRRFLQRCSSGWLSGMDGTGVCVSLLMLSIGATPPQPGGSLLLPALVRRPGSLLIAQQSAMERISRRVASFGRPPAQHSRREALQELLRVRNLYEQRPSVVVPFCEEKLQILQSSPQPKEIADIAPPEVAKLFKACT